MKNFNRSKGYENLVEAEERNELNYHQKSFFLYSMKIFDYITSCAKETLKYGIIVNGTATISLLNFMANVYRGELLKAANVNAEAFKLFSNATVYFSVGTVFCTITFGLVYLGEFIAFQKRENEFLQNFDGYKYDGVACYSGQPPIVKFIFILVIMLPVCSLGVFLIGIKCCLDAFKSYL